MNVKDLFHKLVHGFQVGAESLPKLLGLLESHAGDIEKAAEMALPIIEQIQGMAPNRTTEELQKLGEKFLLHVTPEIVADPDQVETLLQNAAVKELQKAMPGIPNHLLRSGIVLAFNAFHAKSKVAIAAA